MTFKKRIYCVVFYLMTISSCIHAQKESLYSRTIMKHRISIGPVFSFYKIEPNFAIEVKSRIGINIAYKGEFFLGRRTNVLIGVEYLNEGVTFKSYYEAPGYTYLFDKSFAYFHDVRLQRVNLPVSLKLSFNSEKSNTLSTYGLLGAGATYLCKSTTYIESDSTKNSVYEGKTNVRFENYRISKKLSGFYLLGLGAQRNNKINGRALFLELTYNHGLSRLHYEGHEYSNKLEIKNALLAFTFGVRF